MIQRDAARAQVGTLLDWVRQWEREAQDGAEEAAFLLRRAARQIALSADLDIHVEVAEELPAASVTEDARAG